MSPCAILFRLRVSLLALLLCIAPLGASAQDPVTPHYTQWDSAAARAERILKQATASDNAIEELRGQIVGFRDQFIAAESINKDKIDRVERQIEALGAPPGEGESEPSEVTQLRDQLNTQLANLKVPGTRASEAFAEADGLVGEIDKVLRDRKKSQILKRFPTPLNPLHWAEPLRQLRSTSLKVSEEILGYIRLPENRATIVKDLPTALFTLLLGAVLTFRSRHWAERFDQWLETLIARPSLKILRLAGVFLQLALPWAGIVLMLLAVNLSGILGDAGTDTLFALGIFGTDIIIGTWLLRRVFPWREGAVTPLRIDPKRMTYGRWLAGMLVVAISLNSALSELGDRQEFSEITKSYIGFVISVFAAYALFLLARLFRAAPTAPDSQPSDAKFLDNVVHFLAGAGMLVCVLGPIAGAAGFVNLSAALVMPAAVTFMLFAFLALAQRVVGDTYALIRPRAQSDQEGLVPTLIGMALLVASLPVLALIWGARTTDLAELWVKFLEGFSIGDVHVSPNEFLALMAVFAIGYALTRLIQGALQNTILPKTSLDQGARTAIHSGIGYVGIMLAGLIAITTAGINLSSLAILASALAVGIGFGLNSIVSNFVSGIILLIERPVSEGDWIEVGTQMGYVRRISVRATRIETFDRTDVIIPNSDLISQQVTNWTRGNLIGRLIVKVGVAYGSDTRKVERILDEIANDQPLVVISPPPSILFMGFGPDSMQFEIRVILRDINFMLAVQSDINHEIARRFAEENIEIPFAQRDIWLRNPEVLTAGGGATARAAEHGEQPIMGRRRPPIADDHDFDGDGDDY